MKNFVKVISLILVVFSISSLCSCSVFTYDKARFEGGEALDEELLSKIENDLHNGDHTSEETTIDPPHNSAEESGQETHEDSSIVYCHFYHRFNYTKIIIFVNNYSKCGI